MHFLAMNQYFLTKPCYSLCEEIVVGYVVMYV